MPPSLEELILDGGYNYDVHNFTGGIPLEWGSLTNLKELKMFDCGLDGASSRPGPTDRAREANRNPFSEQNLTCRPSLP